MLLRSLQRFFLLFTLLFGVTSVGFSDDDLCISCGEESSTSGQLCKACRVAPAVNCRCGDPTGTDGRLMVQCETCKRWQHVDCLSIAEGGEGDPEDWKDYSCWQCEELGESEELRLLRCSILPEEPFPQFELSGMPPDIARRLALDEIAQAALRDLLRRKVEGL
ncbi:MAG: hypothetical protein HYW48_04240 [Deltaproteobacteria bacterium]|nr:hypothetical protein [Deltaproteobacteria bacterium]